MVQTDSPRRRGAILVPAAAAALLVAMPAAPAGAQDGIRPDATMIQFPDVSREHVVFVYANDIWQVARDGGVAVKLASPPGREMFPRYSADGETIAFVGNYEGDLDLYTVPVSGGAPA
ncbi:MAG: hypothetical protein ACYTG1_04345, partial [Planctomycetota bacterium]